MQIKSPSSTFLSPHWLVWSCSRGHRRALHSCTEVVPGNATLPAQALKLCSRFELFTFINLADAFIQSDLQCSHPKMAQTQQPAKALPPAAQPTAKPKPCRSRLARRQPPKRQGPRPKIVLDPMPRASSWSTGQQEGRAKSCCSQTTPQKASVTPPSPPFSSECGRQSVCEKFCFEHWVLSHSTHTANLFNQQIYSKKNKRAGGGGEDYFVRRLRNYYNK